MTEELKEKITTTITKYERKESAILEIFHIIQKQLGYISEEILEDISKNFEIPYPRLKAVLTFYTMYRTKRLGKYHIQLCRNISCHMAGAQKIKDYLKKKLSISEGEVSEDGLWSICEVECLGSCATAPVIMINETYYENINEERIDRIIAEIVEKEGKKR